MFLVDLQEYSGSAWCIINQEDSICVNKKTDNCVFVTLYVFQPMIF